jgi:ABC-2 type transport system permease protein
MSERRSGTSLGRQLGDTLRALPTLLRVGFRDALAYRAEFFVWVLAYTMPIIMLALWSSVAREAKVGRFGEEDFERYFFATLLVRLSTGAWVVWELNAEVRLGTLQTRLLRPLHPLLAHLVENVAALPMRISMVLPIALVFVLIFGPVSFSHDPLQLALVPLSLLGAFLLTFLPMACVGTLSLFWESSLSIYEVWLGLYTVLSGYVMPLELIPGRFGQVVGYLPFRQCMAFPVENMLGLISREQSLVDLGLQWSWVLLFALLAQAVWRVGMRRFGAYGG